jgi:hypothetical protein
MVVTGSSEGSITCLFDDNSNVQLSGMGKPSSICTDPVYKNTCIHAALMVKEKGKLTDDLTPHILYGAILVDIHSMDRTIRSSSDVDPHTAAVTVALLVPPVTANIASATRD